MMDFSCFDPLGLSAPTTPLCGWICEEEEETPDEQATSKHVAVMTKGTSSTSNKNNSERIVMNPASRDLFMGKLSMYSSPLQDSKLATKLHQQNEQQTPPTCMSSGDEDEDLSPNDSPVMVTTKKKKAFLPIPSLLGGGDTSPRSSPVKKFSRHRLSFTMSSSSSQKSQKPLVALPDLLSSSCDISNSKGNAEQPEKSKYTPAAAHHVVRPGRAHASSLRTSFIQQANDYQLTSTEVDPAPFQVELPCKLEITVHAKICALMHQYTHIHADSNLGRLAGLSRTSLMKEYYERSSIEQPLLMGGSCHRDIVRQLLACADDIVMEGFFREFGPKSEENKDNGHIEVGVFSSESLRQIIVCWKGGLVSKAKLKPATNDLPGEQNVPILSTFYKAYWGTPVAQKVFAFLSSLATRKPFFDVAMTGHSFGAAMAMIAALRYASSNPSMRVCCNVFGCPMIGGEVFRQRVHSVPNLRVFRVENGSDPIVKLPSSGGIEWIHCGHAIQIRDTIIYSTGKPTVQFKTHRFIRDRSASSTSRLRIPKNLSPGASSQGKVDHEIQSYLNKLTESGDSWFSEFCELKGDGVNGAMA